MKLDFCFYISLFQGRKERVCLQSVTKPQKMRLCFLSPFQSTNVIARHILLRGEKINMKKTIVLSSITYALKAQELLKTSGIYANISRSKAVKSVRGCGYGLSIESLLFEKARDIIASADIPVIGSVDEK